VSGAAASGDYTLVVSGVAEATNVHTVAVGLALTSGLPDAPAVLSPADGTMGLDAQQVALSWELLPRVSDYRLQVDIEPSFSTPVVNVAGISGSTYTLAGVLSPATCYFWRVQGESACGPGDWAAPFHFTTAAPSVQWMGDVGPGTEEGADLLSGPGLAILGVAPDQAIPGQQTPVTISGTAFLPTPLVMLGGTALPGVTYVSSTTLTALVPAGMPPGIYDLTVVNRDCQNATLAAAFTIECRGEPEAMFSSDSPAGVGEAMHFTATVTGTLPLSYTWDFGGPGEGSGLDTLRPAYTYAVPGDFVVSLAVVDACGSVTFTGPVTVERRTYHVYLPLVREQAAGR
jgi:hypothetical protein